MKPRYLNFLLLVSSTSTAEYPARVIGITDGDTPTVLTAQKVQVKIRLAGIDAPESGQDFGARAKQAASELVFGKSVTIVERDKNRYDRTIADVWLPEGKSLNREMVGSGMAWWYRKYADKDRMLARLEAEARQAKRGLWSQMNQSSVPFSQLSFGNAWVRLAMTAKEAAEPGGLPGLGLRRHFEPGDVTVLVERDEKIPAGWCVDPQTVRAVGGNAVAPGISVGADDRAAAATVESSPPLAYCVPDHREDLSYFHLRTREQRWGLH
jgi:endonuclease YncB( thermonuclease family)